MAHKERKISKVINKLKIFKQNKKRAAESIERRNASEELKRKKKSEEHKCQNCGENCTCNKKETEN